MSGFAVVDVETTGLHPGFGERVVAVAVVHVSREGEVTGAWDTLVNPQCDLGPKSIYGTSAAEVRDAPVFEDIAGPLAELLAGRVMVSHNHSFVARFIRSEFRRLGYDVPVAGLCTMVLARTYIGPSRSLAACCHCFGVEIPDAHRAQAGAQATAELLSGYLGMDPRGAHWNVAMTRAKALHWPPIAGDGEPWRTRECSSTPAEPFLSQLVHRLPDPELSVRGSQYLATLDRALLDGHFTASQASAVDAIADDLGVGRIEAAALNALYLRDLAVVAWSDGVITDEERADLRAVGELLSCYPGDVDNVLADTRPAGGAMAVPIPQQSNGFALSPGDLVVFTGEMSCTHAVLEELARSAGLSPHGAVTKKVALVVAADPDSLAGKARRAHDFGIPVVTEQGFRRMIGADMPAPRRSRR